MSTATEAEILGAVERWARVHGWYRNTDQNRGTARLGWHVSLHGDGLVHIWLQAEGQHVTSDRSWSIAPAITLAWAILVESELPPVDVGPCPDCKGRGWEEKQCSPVRGIKRTALAIQGWDPTGGTFPTDDGERPSEIWRRRCPACSGTGRKLTPVSRLLLDATTDAAARAELLVYADLLQNAGDPRGDLLMWALMLWTGEPSDCGECRACGGGGQLPGGSMYPRPAGNPLPMDPCHVCRRAPGRQLGYPHTGEAVRWLERGEL